MSTALPATPAKVRSLRAGALSLRFEPDLAFARYIQFDGVEILRGIYPAVRDRNWGTVPHRLMDVKVTEHPDGFDLQLEGQLEQPGIAFAWKCGLTGRRDGTLVFTMTGRALSTFERNRIGFCVLHPASCAGKQWRSRHTDGSTRDGAFPALISPQQPLLDLIGLVHWPRPGLEIEVQLHGDTFEMEDQRNWTDASYKTYCTPLARPFPVRVPAGTTIRQTIEVRAKSTARTVPAPARLQAAPQPVQIVPAAGESIPLMPWGLGWRVGRTTPADTRELLWLRTIRPAHLRVDLFLGGGTDVPRILAAAAATAAVCGAAIELVLLFGPDPTSELDGVQPLLEAQRGLRVSRVIVATRRAKVTPPELFASVAPRLRGMLPGVPLGAGTEAYFTELNRNRPDPTTGDFVFFSANPQVHAFDNASLIETNAMLPVIVENARSWGDRPVAVSPITLRPRFNPNATADEPPDPPGRLPARYDPRQATRFGAVWTLGALAGVASARPQSVTFFETAGPGGLGLPAGSDWGPHVFPATAGTVFPLYHVFAALAEMPGARLRPLSISDELAVTALLIESAAGRRLLLGNARNEPLAVGLPALGTEAGRCLVLDAETEARATADPGAFRSGPRARVDFSQPVVLPPEAIVQLEFS
jgi:D-apionolactonase